jgi:hypothetical protein
MTTRWLVGDGAGWFLESSMDGLGPAELSETKAHLFADAASAEQAKMKATKGHAKPTLRVFRVTIEEERDG